MNKLKQKIMQSKQVYARKQFLLQCDPLLAKTLSAVEYDPSIDIGQLAIGWPKDPYKGCDYQEFDDWSHLTEAALKITLPDFKALLALGQEICHFKVDSSIWTTDNSSLLKSLADTHQDFLYLVCEDASHGLIISQYVGHLPSERMTNNREIVYELISW